MQKFKIEDINPYFRNPRKNKEAVDAVATAISHYGYNVPIVVDKEGVIIAGHVRYQACLLLGMEELDCVVLDISEKKAREFRIVDNKIGEFTKWDEEALLIEMRDFGEDVDLNAYLIDINLDDVIAGSLGIDYESPTQENIDAEQKEKERHFEKLAEQAFDDKVEILCPCCGEIFYVSRKNIVVR